MKCVCCLHHEIADNQSSQQQCFDTNVQFDGDLVVIIVVLLFPQNVLISISARQAKRVLVAMSHICICDLSMMDTLLLLLSFC